MESLEYLTKEKPETIKGCIDFVIKNLNYKAPRVKWEASRVIAKICHKFPDKVANAIPGLLENTKDRGTVVRWSAAFALTEIAKSNSELKERLIPDINKILNSETNNGVKKIYLNFLKGK
ncbi:MAG: hypothetical protein WHS77_07100 [Brevinematales bacterium]